MKTCSKCGESKQLSAFYSKSNRCIPCHKIVSKEWVSKNHDRRKEIVRKNNKTPESRARRSVLLAKRRAIELECLSTLDDCELLTVETMYLAAQLSGCHVDHIKPLSKGGLHIPSNLQLLTPLENWRKGNSYEEPC